MNIQEKKELIYTMLMNLGIETLASVSQTSMQRASHRSISEEMANSAHDKTGFLMQVLGIEQEEEKNTCADEPIKKDMFDNIERSEGSNVSAIGPHAEAFVQGYKAAISERLFELEKSIKELNSDNLKLFIRIKELENLVQK